MNFDEAIQAHAAWKVKLSAYLYKCDGSLKSADVRVDNRCPLGQWLHGEGKKYASLAEYQTLIKEHARFHLAAGECDRQGKQAARVQPPNVSGEF